MKLKIINALGDLVREESLDQTNNFANFTININELSAGVYYLKFITVAETFQKKIMLLK